MPDTPNAWVTVDKSALTTHACVLAASVHIRCRRVVQVIQVQVRCLRYSANSRALCTRNETTSDVAKPQTQTRVHGRFPFSQPTTE